ncbi:V-set and transmembrane domain-containing protein 5-like isoform X2 [Narcine bancroftii]|uniref:V-set and transmembrane domain-containing protein 5-like isoform X2 n=1 Tax=Narcine bancroftii TaxID=1343680 RepID=UPI0038317642
MTCVVRAVIFKLCILLYKNHIVTPSKGAEMVEHINASIGEDVLFSVNCTSCMNQSIEWKKTGTSQTSIVMFPFHERELTIFEGYKSRVKDFKNGSFLLTNIQLNDTGCYIVTLVDTAGKQMTITKQLFVIAKTNDLKDEHIKKRGNMTRNKEIKKSRKFPEIPVVKRNENVNTNIPEIVYSTYVGAYVSYGKSCQTASLDQT